jgi:putative ATPase
VGLADAHALNQVVAALQAFDLLGMPEGALALAQAAVYLACAPKSNALYVAMGQAQKDARDLGPLEAPLHIRNAPTRLMKDLGYGQGYEYPHDHKDAVVGAEYLPETLRGRRYYRPGEQGREKFIAGRLSELRAAKARMRAAAAKEKDRGGTEGGAT